MAFAGDSLVLRIPMQRRSQNADVISVSSWNDSVLSLNNDGASSSAISNANGNEHPTAATSTTSTTGTRSLSSDKGTLAAAMDLLKFRKKKKHIETDHEPEDILAGMHRVHLNEYTEPSPTTSSSSSSFVDVANSYLPEHTDTDTNQKKHSDKKHHRHHYFSHHRHKNYQTPVRTISTIDAGPPVEYVPNEDQMDKVKTKIMSAWNNVRYGWTVKTKTHFNHQHPLFLLGKCYHAKNEVGFETETDKQHPPDIELFKQDFISRIWFTYRRGFPTISGSQFTTDCGWGCMLRSGQMMLAQALIMHFLGRAATSTTSTTGTRSLSSDKGTLAAAMDLLKFRKKKKHIETDHEPEDILAGMHRVHLNEYTEPSPTTSSSSFVDVANSYLPEHTDTDTNQKKHSDKKHHRHHYFSHHRHKNYQTPVRTISTIDAGPPVEYVPNEDQMDKVKTKIMSAWNNVRYGWTVKTKTHFNHQHPLFLLGKCYHAKNEVGFETETDKQHPPDIELFKQDFISRIWFTYRRGFPTISGSQFTTDCGWGCMLRSGQMMLAQALIMHFLGRDWNLFLASPSREHDTFHRQIIRWFGDCLSKNTPFSVHRLVQLGKDSGKMPGDWYGPASVAHIIKIAMENAFEFNPILGQVCVYVSQDSTVYKQDIIDLCTKRPRAETFNSSTSLEHSYQETEGASEDHWRAVIILIPVRLGGEILNHIYTPCIQSCLAYDMCIGVIGGKPKHSLYFVGFQDEKLIHLDPHYCQDVVNVVTDNNFPIQSFHCVTPRKMSFSKMDPSCTIGFYCRTRQDFEQFFVHAKEFLSPPKQKGQYPMFIFSEGRSNEVNCESYHPKNDKFLRVRHLNDDGKPRSPSKESEDFVFL
ncbi:uncharacterized protein LOC106180057 [Lingula anatina]|uniref:Cysteine protease n=1 Tax=Lingula anatina TaxID=7574 RepID=A0A1S3KAA7_LINAN|nr:uncharacterized protein LOC106180057 [Lingula anatina]|eukprot:XP_013419384.1 uncharacterized protein LOC106180057 [Lingula anatina]